RGHRRKHWLGSPDQIQRHRQYRESGSQDRGNHQWRANFFAAAATFEEIRDIASIAGHLNVKLKGLNQPVPIYEITGIGGDYGVYKSEQDSATT
ncbi:MAG TPA: hypothetical protein QF861_10280, partial [Alphaproteobacteria bacterium]|nr:hypothetical protein [Alphaproteobacteria bacterium]